MPRNESLHVYSSCFLEYADELEAEAAADPERVRVTTRKDGTIITRIFPTEYRDQKNHTIFLLPDCIKFRPNSSDWLVSLRVIGTGYVIAKRDGRTIGPFDTTATRAGAPLRKFSGPSGKLTVAFIKDGELIILAPIVRYDQTYGGWRVRLNLQKPAAVNELRQLLDNYDNHGHDGPEEGPDEEPGATEPRTEKDDPDKSDNWKADIMAYRANKPLTGPHRNRTPSESSA